MKITPNWLTILLIILSNDVQLNPGPSPQNFNFMTWNVNSIAKDNFERVGLIEAHTRHGGVGLFFKNTHPIIIRNDLSFDKSIIVELKFISKPCI